MRITQSRQKSANLLIAALLTVILFASLLFTLTIPVRGQGAQRTDSQTEPVFEPTVVRVYFRSQADLQQLAVDLDVWEVNQTDGYVVALINPIQQEQLIEQGFWVALALAENEHMRAVRVLATPAHASDGIPGFSCYRTVEETYTDLAALAEANPELADWVDIGDSWDKTIDDDIDGYDLQTFVLTNHASDAPKSTFFLMTAIHARELATAELATRFAEKLVSDYGQDPDITWLLDHNEVHILPLANPDGRKFAEQLEYWRKNTNNTDGCTTFPNYGVDLNRNSSFKWNQCEGSGCSSAQACGITFRGSAPASEPEVQAFQNYVIDLMPDQRGENDDDAAPDDASGLFLTVHSYGGLVLYPWGWSETPTPNRDQLRTLGRKFGHHTGYSVCQVSQPGCIYQVDGSSDDWAYGELGVAAFTFEIGTTFFQSCSYFENNILDDNIDALIYASKSARRPYLTPAGPDALNVTFDPPAVSAGENITLLARLDDTRYASNGYGIEPTQPISAARFTIDAPSWLTGTENFSMSAVDGAFDNAVEDALAVIDTSGWAVGRHLVMVEGLDEDGNWGAPTAQFVEIVDGALGLEMNPLDLTDAGAPGGAIAYATTVTNTGSVTDSYGVAVGGHFWLTELATDTVMLAPSTSTLLRWSVQVPLSATVGISDTAIISVTSQTSPALQRTIRTTSTASNRQLYLPIVAQ